jgi:hypothetical protein
MTSSEQWLKHFRTNATQARIDTTLKPQISDPDKKAILHSLKAWQKGETSEGKHLLQAASKHADEINDPIYLDVIELFIKEEQKHGENLGRYVDALGEQRISFDWGDQLFRYARGWNRSITSWTMAVLIVESAAQIFYTALRDASDCILLKQICTDILIDEAYHIQFQSERLAFIMSLKSPFWRAQYLMVYQLLFSVTHRLIWMAHKRAFRHGGWNKERYMFSMRRKFERSLNLINTHCLELDWKSKQYKSSI